MLDAGGGLEQGADVVGGGKDVGAARYQPIMVEPMHAFVGFALQAGQPEAPARCQAAQRLQGCAEIVLVALGALERQADRVGDAFAGY